MAEETAVSVIMPVYNSAYCVKRGIRSIINQPSFDRMELLLIDDGSTDDSGKICDEFASEHPNVKVFHKQNEGVGKARNFGIKQASGKYLAFVDADDFIKCDFFSEEKINSLVSTNADVYGFSARVISFDFRFYTIQLIVEDYDKICRGGGTF